MNILTVNPITEENLQDITRVHMSAFPGSALTKLGDEAVFRYYHWLLTGPHQHIAVAAFDEAKVVGYLFGGLFAKPMAGFLDRNRNFLIFRLVTHPWLMAHSIIFDRMGWANRLLRKQKLKNTNHKGKVCDPSFCVLAIAVNPMEQRRGAGKLLMEYAECAANQRGFQQMNLTVAVDNLKAVQFYMKLGWQKVSAENWHGKMVKRLPVNRSVPAASFAAQNYPVSGTNPGPAFAKDAG